MTPPCWPLPTSALRWAPVALPQRVSPPTSVVMTDDLIKAAEAVRIGRRTMRVALESIWIGIGLSIGLMVVAAFGYIPAIIGVGPATASSRYGCSCHRAAPDRDDRHANPGTDCR